MKPVPPEIDLKRAFAVLQQLKAALLTARGRALFVSGAWNHDKTAYAKLLQTWPVTEVGFHRWRLTGIFSKILGLLKYDFIFKLEDQSFLVNIVRLFELNCSIAIWSIDSAEEADFKAALLARRFVPDIRISSFGEDLERFSPNLFWLRLLEDLSYDDPFLWLRCGEKVPRAFKQIISDNNLELYVEYAANH